MREGQVLFTYLHLAASKECTDALLDRKVTGIAYETVELPDRVAAAARPDVRGRRPAGPAGRRVPPDARRRRPRRADGRRLRRVRGQGRGHRRRRLRHERRRDRARHAGRGAAAGQEHRPAARRPTPIYRGHLQTVASNAYEVERAVLDADLVIGAVLVPGAKAPDAGLQRAGLPDEAGQRAGRHLDRPGRLLRGLAADHARRPGLPGARVDLLLRGEHARRGAAHQHLRADQRHPAVRAGAGQPRLARGAARATRRWRWASTPTTGRSPTARSPRRTAWRTCRWPRCWPDARSPDDPPQAAHRRCGGSVRAYLDHLTVERGCPRNTLASYRRDLDRYAAPGRGRASTELAAVGAGATSPRTSRALRAGDAGTRRWRRPRPPGRSARCAACTASPLREGLVGDDAGREVTPARAAPAAAQGARTSTDGASGLLDARPATAGRSALRDRALLEFLYGTGARISEAVGAAVDDLDLDRRARCCCAARAAGPGWCRSAGTPATRCEAYLVRARPGAGRRRPGHAGGVPQRPRRARCPGRAPGTILRRAARPGRAAGRRPQPSRRTPCATRTPPTCSTAAPTSGWCRNCSATRR